MMDMMHQMQGMVENMTPDKMQRMSKMMMDMSKIMQKGEVSQKEYDT